MLESDWLASHVRTWTASHDRWFIDRDAGLGLLDPMVTVATDADDPQYATFSIRGSIQAVDDPRSRTPAGWPGLPPPDTAATVLYTVLDRGESAIADLRGAFALACWDGRRQRLLLARDHVGQRGMFVATQPDHVFFCSELAPLLRMQTNGCRLDDESAFWHLAFGMPVPGRTLASGISRVPAAHVWVWEPGRPPHDVRYWTPLTAGAARHADEATLQQLRSTITTSVAGCLDDERHSGVMLSGGIDSTYLAATASATAPSRVTAFTVRFEQEAGVNEDPYATAVAEWLNLEQHVAELRAPEAIELLEDVVLLAAEPCTAWATVSHVLMLATVHQQGIVHLLSGLGADEIFGGYDHHRSFYARYLRRLAANPAPPGVDDFTSCLMAESQGARRTLYPGVARFLDDVSLRSALEPPYNTWQYASHLRTFYRECLRLKPEADPIEMMVAHECQHRIPDLLMANFEPVARRMGVVTHYPFLTPETIEIASGLAPESRYRTPAGRFSLRLKALDPRFKHAMIQLASDRVPPAILNRPRKSYTAPVWHWLRDPKFSSRMVNRLQNSGLWDYGLVRRHYLDELLGRLEAGPGPAMHQLWTLVTLTAWYDRYVSH